MQRLWKLTSACPGRWPKYDGLGPLGPLGPLGSRGLAVDCGRSDGVTVVTVIPYLFLYLKKEALEEKYRVPSSPSHRHSESSRGWVFLVPVPHHVS